MANDKKSKKSLTEYLGTNPKAYTPFDVPAIVSTAIKEKRQDKKRKKDKTSLKKNKDMIMGGLKGYRKPSGKKADPDLFTLEELGAMENPSYPLTKKQKTRIYGDPNATYSLDRTLKKSGGLTKTVPPKRGPNPQGLKGGADIDIFGFGNENFQYGSGKASYTFEGNKSSITPSISGSVIRSNNKTVKKSFDRVGLEGEYKPNKKTKLKGKVSRNVHGDKDYRGMIGAEYKNKNKKFDISLDETGRVNVGANLKFNKGGCPHREVGAKSDIQGVKDIQVKGKKFTGSL